jgi:hypothetical protein
MVSPIIFRRSAMLGGMRAASQRKGATDATEWTTTRVLYLDLPELRLLSNSVIFAATQSSVAWWARSEDWVSSSFRDYETREMVWRKSNRSGRRIVLRRHGCGQVMKIPAQSEVGQGASESRVKTVDRADGRRAEDGGVVQSFNNCLAITSLCISLVPSPIVHNFTSR